MKPQELIVVRAEAPARRVVTSSEVDEAANRQELRAELQEAFGSCTADAARRFLGESTGRGTRTFTSFLSDDEVRAARKALAARRDVR